MNRFFIFIAAFALASLLPVMAPYAKDSGWQRSCEDGSCHVSIAFSISMSGDYVLYFDPDQGHCLLQLSGWDGKPAPLYGAAITIDNDYRIDFSSCNNQGCAVVDPAGISALRDAALRGSDMLIEVSDGNGWYDQRISLDGFAEALGEASKD